MAVGLQAQAHARARAHQHTMRVVINTGVGTLRYVASANGACACEPAATASGRRFCYPVCLRTRRARVRPLRLQIATLKLRLCVVELEHEVTWKPRHIAPRLWSKLSVTSPGHDHIQIAVSTSTAIERPDGLNDFWNFR